jgi:hypothetical protein
MTVGQKICILWYASLRHLPNEVLLTPDIRNRKFSTANINSHNRRRYRNSFNNIQFSQPSYMISLLIPVLFSNLFRCLSSEIRHAARIPYLHHLSCMSSLQYVVLTSISKQHMVTRYKSQNSFFLDIQISSSYSGPNVKFSLFLFPNISQIFSMT